MSVDMRAKAERMLAAYESMAALIPAVGWMEDMADVLRAYLATPASPGEWVAFADRPPAERKYVLAAERIDGGKWCRQTAVAFPDGEVRDAYGNRIKPTHWMPLPEPPAS